MVFNRSIVGSIMKQVSLCCTTYDTHSILVALTNSYGISSPDAQKKLQDIAKDLRLWMPSEGDMK